MKKRFKVLVIIPSGRCFGLQNISFDFIDALSHDFEFCFVITHWSDGEFQQRVETRGLTYVKSWLGFLSRSLIPLNLWMTAQYVIRLPKVYWDIYQAWHRFEPNVMWFANYHELMALGPVLRFLDKPVVCHLHDPPPLQGFYRRMFQWWSPPVTRFISISKSVDEQMKNHGVPATKIDLVHNGIPLEKFPYREQRENRFIQQFGWPQDSYIIGITGQMHANKGHEDLLEACRIVWDKIPTLRLAIGGKELQTEFAKLLFARIREMGAENKVAFTGWMDQVSDFYAAVDCVVMPSRHEEGFGLVAVEAMACGCQVIGTRSGGLEEVLDYGRMGLLVPQNDPAALAGAIEELFRVKDKSSRNSVGREWVENQFNLKMQAQKFAECFVRAAHYQ